MPSAVENNIINVINAYNQAAKGKTAEVTPKGAPSGGEFADLVKGAIEEAKNIGVKSEQLSVAGIAGSADISQVVTAVAEAEVTLQTVVSIRDKVLEAYKDILRMPI